MYKHLIVSITKWHNSCNTYPSVPFFLPNMRCLMVKVWCKFEQNRTKAIEVIEQKPQMLTEFWNHGMTDMLKTVYPLKLRFAGDINMAVTSIHVCIHVGFYAIIINFINSLVTETLVILL